MPTEKLKISNYDEARFQRLEASLQKDGLKFPAGESGEVKDFGADVDFSHDVATNTLTLDIKHGPHLHNFDDFVAKLTERVKAQA
jgi:hypothetical protein